MLIACGNSDDSSPILGGAGGVDAAVDAATPAYPDAGTVSGPCDPTSTEPQCPANFECLYPIIDGCGAQPVCVALPEARCESAVSACGCDGGGAQVPCYFYGANGYATAPITGVSSTVPADDGGFTDECAPFPDAGP